MSTLDDDIRKALANGDAACDLDQEEGVFRQMASLFRGKMRWMTIAVTIESIVCVVLIVLAVIEFFRTDDVKWQICYATGVVLLTLLVVLVKLWGWMQMNRYAIQRDIKRLELRVIESRASKRA